ncbi:MAG: hypothetical protein UV71_C0002G0035 [Microgenomates group bacterium GW2011_GWC1_43_13]|nr:MAG: hypothetical protein UV71_C0002G0035 [Microgenomates group bacterium GW2011_GWC1_43_13]KKT33202.1 MAG: hypothetical protein UW20_C0004G0036 [Candidatus Woesebacteria bacterium GW2011_GWB1_44_11]KKT54460.1 MAG: hypothetical protein UW47_C0005G0008 [Candidatus Woesebacteria bacterium GW2011_GWA1_44_23]
MKDPDIERRIFETKRNWSYDEFKTKLGIDIVREKQLENLFRNGMEEGSVIFVPVKKEDGVLNGILNINTVIAGEKLSKNILIDDEHDAAFLLGLQGSIDASKE